MSISSEIRDERSLTETAGRVKFRFPGPAVPYLLAAADGIAVVVSGLAAGIGYNFSVGSPIPDVTPYFAVGLLAAVIQFLQMNRKGYYAFPDSARPGVEINDILVSWSTTGLLLAL